MAAQEPGHALEVVDGDEAKVGTEGFGHAGEIALFRRCEGLGQAVQRRALAFEHLQKPAAIMQQGARDPSARLRLAAVAQIDSSALASCSGGPA